MFAVHVLCNLPSIHFSIISLYLHWLVENNFPVVEWATFHPFFKANHNPPKVLTSYQCHVTFTHILSPSLSRKVWFFFLEISSQIVHVYIIFFHSFLKSYPITLGSSCPIILGSFPCHNIVLTTVPSVCLLRVKEFL